MSAMWKEERETERHTLGVEIVNGFESSSSQLQNQIMGALISENADLLKVGLDVVPPPVF